MKGKGMKEIRILPDENGVFHVVKDPYCTIEVQTKEDFERLQEAMDFYTKYHHALVKEPHGAIVDIDKVYDVLEAAQIISDGEYCGFCTEDVHDGLKKLLAENVLFPSTKEE